MFAQAINNTRPTTASNASSGRANRSRSGEAPLPAKSSLNGCFRNVSPSPAALGMDPARMAGCAARSAVVASCSDCPHFSLSMTRNHGPSSGYGVDDMITGCVLTGIAMSNDRPTMTPRNAGGVTPITVTGTRLNRILDPMICGAPAYCRCQNG